MTQLAAWFARCALIPALLLVNIWVEGGTAWAQALPNEVLAALRAADIYVEAGTETRLTQSARAQLTSYTRQRALDGYPLKLAVVQRPPQTFRSLGQFVEAAHGALNLGDGFLIVVAVDAGNGVGSVSAKSAALSDSAIERLQRKNLGAFTAASYAEGFQALSEDLIEEIQGERQAARLRGQLVVGTVLIIVLALATTWLVRRARAWDRELGAAQRLADQLYPAWRQLDEDTTYDFAAPDRRPTLAASAEARAQYSRGSHLLNELAALPWLRAVGPGQHWLLLHQASTALEGAERGLSEAGATPAANERT